jgi:hypothetical protein
MGTGIYLLVGLVNMKQICYIAIIGFPQLINLPHSFCRDPCSIGSQCCCAPREEEPTGLQPSPLYSVHSRPSVGCLPLGSFYAFLCMSSKQYCVGHCVLVHAPEYTTLVTTQGFRDSRKVLSAPFFLHIVSYILENYRGERSAHKFRKSQIRKFADLNIFS